VGERETSGSREMRRASTVTDPLTRTPVILFLLLRFRFPRVPESVSKETYYRGKKRPTIECENQHARERVSCAAGEWCDVGERFAYEKLHRLS
jgi:hypothetical protein